MRHDFDYTSSARRLWAKYPLLTFLSIQMSFWICATLLLGILLHVHSLQIGEMANLPPVSELATVIKVSVVFGILYALFTGVAAYFLERSLYRTASLGAVILFNTAISFTILALLLTLARRAWTDFLMPAYLKEYPLTHRAWEYLFVIILVYFLSMTLVINFINQLNKRYGRGILVPLILGRYRQPREEDRIFMFMDLRSSTTHAEKLGHLRYSAFIRDAFMDINRIVPSYDADIYQYVGDEVVLSWRMNNGIAEANCIMFFFACIQAFEQRKAYYLSNYGRLPEFKAGVHGGRVVAVEIGDSKREIAYHGEVLHTGARIQALCNQYGRSLIVSSSLIEKIKLTPSLQAIPLEEVSLRGKEETVSISAIVKV